MAELGLDQIVKGAPPADVSAPEVAIAALPADSPPERVSELYESKKPGSSLAPSDPTSTLPSSPPQIYLNLLILEASLRSQYLALHARRRQHTFFLSILGLWVAWFFYAVFLRVREDGTGMGGSVYWVQDMGEKVAFMGGFFTAVLIWATGQWERGLRWPRRWVGITNRGLRGMNLKIVILRGPWWRQPFSYLAYFFPYSSFFPSSGTSYQLVEKTEKRMSTISKHGYRDGITTSTSEEDVAAGGDTLKLLLLPKAFSPEFRENWDIYRTAYWERENERRAELRSTLKMRSRELAKKQRGWLWWTGWGGAKRAVQSKIPDPEKIAPGHRARVSKDLRRSQPKSSSTGPKPPSRSNTPSLAESDDLTEVSERRRPQKTGSSSSVSTTRSSKSLGRKSTSANDSSDSSNRTSPRRGTLSSEDSSATRAGAGAEWSARSLKVADEARPLPNVRTRQRDLVSDSGED